MLAILAFGVIELVFYMRLPCWHILSNRLRLRRNISPHAHLFRERSSLLVYSGSEIISFGTQKLPVKARSALTAKVPRKDTGDFRTVELPRKLPEIIAEDRLQGL